MTDSLRAQLQASLGGAYSIERELGGGGMSRVFVARDEALGRDVVIKVLSPELAATLSTERFTREIKLAAALQEPHIVPVHSAGVTSDGLPWYTMPFMRGDSLRARLGAGRLPLGESVGILRNVAQALAYAHESGIVHRDIKPENVLLSSGTAVVTDFGIAKALTMSRTEAPGGTLTQAGTSLGTPGYMAPEQVAGDDVDARADLYAWGVMAYELLAGRHPFSDKTTAQQLLAAHLAERPKELVEQLPVGERRDPVAQRLAALVMGCLEKQASARPASAGALLATLDAVTTPGGGMPLGRRAPQSRTVAIGAGALVLIAAAVVLFVRNRREDLPLLEPKRVVVATFENKSGDKSLDPLGQMAADWIARGLANTGMVDVGGTAAELAARGATSSTVGGATALQALARDAKAGIVVSGAYYRQGDSVLFQADFTDANLGKLIQSVGPVAASVRSPLDGVERLRQRVTGALAPLVDSTLAGMASLTSRPPSMEAYREFLAGEELFYKDERAAIVHFARAAALDSNYVYPLIRILGAFDNLRDAHGLDSLGRVLDRHRDLLTPYERAYVAYILTNMEADPERGVTHLREMLRLAPKSQFVAYLVGLLEVNPGRRFQVGDSILSRLDPDAGALRGRVYYYGYRADALHALGHFDQELELAQRARRLHAGRLYIAQFELRALAALGRTDEVARRLDEALSQPADVSQWTPIRVASFTIHELRAHDHPDAASAMSGRLLQWIAARPAAVSATIEGRRDRAEALLAAGRWDELQPIADSLVGEAPSQLAHLRLRGVALAMRGERAEAERMSARIAAGAYGHKWGLDVQARAAIAAALGDKDAAVALLAPAWYMDQSSGSVHGTFTYGRLRDYPPFIALIKPRD